MSGAIIKLPSADKITLVKDYNYFRHLKVDGSDLIDFNPVEGEETTKADSRDFFRETMRDAMNTAIGKMLTTKMRNTYPALFLAKVDERFRSGLISEGQNAESEPWPDVFAITEASKQAVVDAYNKRIAAGVIESDDFPVLFKQETEVFISSGSHIMGGIVHKTSYHTSMFGNYWEVLYRIIAPDSTGPREFLQTAYVDDWPGVTEIKSLPIQMKAEGEVLDSLNRRGEKFRQVVGNSAKYMMYSGQIARSGYFGANFYRADGRVMVDSKSFKVIDRNGYDMEVAKMRISKLDEEESFGRSRRRPQDSEETSSFDLTEKDQWRCVPYVLGFSFRAKKWGRMNVEQISDINYRTNAFQQLVLDENIKTTIRALVQNNAGTFEDIIDNKGGGCIFLLEGEPGQGKTLTAETVAEDLRRPLYPVSVGELGTNPDALEQRLRQILDIATNWDAVLLLDEADIFLEKRDSRDILRNAMVGVFLRLLEYHQGVLFLTTNRSNNIDPAFFSRISLAISFPAATPEKRRQVWKNLLGEAKLLGSVTERNIDDLKDRDINGRQIKNAIRQSQTIAKSENRDMTIQDLNNTLQLGQAFMDKLARRRNVFYRAIDWVKENT